MFELLRQEKSALESVWNQTARRVRPPKPSKRKLLPNDPRKRVIGREFDPNADRVEV